MPESLRNSIAQRRFRLAQTIIVAGSLALGLLVLTRLVDVFRTDFILYYGVTHTEYDALQQTAAARFPFTVGQMAITLLALSIVAWFVRCEQARLRQSGVFSDHCRGGRLSLVTARPTFAAMFDQFVQRTAGFAGLLFSVWLLQTSFGRWLGGFGLGLEYANWRSLLPLASIFGLCVLVGMLVAAISMVGLRTILLLEAVLAKIQHRPRRVTARPALPRTVAVRRTFRELLGCDILSRPPPAFA